MRINYSKNLKKFKKNVGQANQFIITILIGLRGVEIGKVTKEEGFNTTWNPKNVKDSTERSKEFMLKSALIFLVDNLDMYIKSSNREPRIITNDELHKNLNDINNNSIRERFKIINNHFKINEIDSNLVNMVDLLIYWRNRVVHFDAYDNLSNACKKDLVENKSKIHSRFCGLNIEDALYRYEERKSPSFKETTSLIKACIDYVYIIDGLILKETDINNYFERIVNYYFSNKEIGTINSKSIERINKFYVKTEKRKQVVIRNLLNEYSIVGEGQDYLYNSIQNLATYDYAQLKNKFFN